MSGPSSAALVCAITVVTGSTVEDLQSGLLVWAGPTRCPAAAGQGLAARSAHMGTQNAPPSTANRSGLPVDDDGLSALSDGGTAPVRDRADRCRRAVPELGYAGLIIELTARSAALVAAQREW
jgi:hypothetical protein